MKEWQFHNFRFIYTLTRTKPTTGPTIVSFWQSKTPAIADSVTKAFLTTVTAEENILEAWPEPLVHPEIYQRVVAGVGHSQPVSWCPYVLKYQIKFE